MPPKRYRDYAVEDGELVESHSSRAPWRCTEGMQFDYGFELTQDQELDRRAHLLCRVPFDLRRHKRLHVCIQHAAQTEPLTLQVSLEYTMGPQMTDRNGGEGLCLYLADPSVVGWDTDFEGGGSVGTPTTTRQAAVR